MNKTALVIGGSGGIGSAAADVLLKGGFEVYATYHNHPPEHVAGSKRETKPPDDEEAKQREGRGTVPAPSFLQMDLGDGESVRKTLSRITAEKAVDVIVWAVSLPIKNRPVMTMEWPEIESHFNLQVKGLFTLFECLKKQIAGKHKTKFIILLTEYVTGKPPKSLAHYVTAKYALMGLSKSLAAELAAWGSTVNMISPGMVDTGLISDLPPKLVEMTAESNPMKRIARPDDISGLILFLAGDQSDYLNGAHITLNGGGVML